MSYEKHICRLTVFCVGLAAIILVLTGKSDAQLDVEGAVAIWLFDEGRGDKYPMPPAMEMMESL